MLIYFLNYDTDLKITKRGYVLFAYISKSVSVMKNNKMGCFLFIEKINFSTRYPFKHLKKFF